MRMTKMRTNAGTGGALLKSYLQSLTRIARIPPLVLIERACCSLEVILRPMAAVMRQSFRATFISCWLLILAFGFSSIFLSI
jgi:hypothetical protein